MSLTEINDLPVRSMATDDAHLFLWTTNRYLEPAYGICRWWGFDPVKPIVWIKPPNAGFIGGTFGGASVEFCLYAKRPRSVVLGKAGRQWFDWPRRCHSEKPEAFLDLVETVCPGPYLELFARRNRLGWDTWGDEALQHVELA